jgi:hypothetical protein
MKRIKFEINCFFVQIGNLIQFVTIALKRGTPIHLWPEAWRLIKQDHEAKVRKTVFQLRMAGRVRQDADGRLYSNRKGDE